MPSPAKPTKLCVFGDSHIGCIKHALNDKLFVPQTGLEIDFWGATGPTFRDLHYVDGKIVPAPSALPLVQAVNDTGHDVLDPNAFDAILFMATRIRSQNFFEPVLHHIQQPNGYLSEAVFQQNCADWLRKQKYYQIACDFAQNSNCKSLLAMTTFLSEASPDTHFSYPDATKPNPHGVDRIWQHLEDTAHQDGVILLRQLPETCGDGCTTKAEFDRINVDGTKDTIHRNPAYGALVLTQTAAALQ